jgi:hypothetical protein
MKWQTAIFAALTSTWLLSSASHAGEPVSIDDIFNGNIGVNLASVSGRLSVGNFNDSRTGVGADAIEMAGQMPVTLTGSTVTGLVQSAFEQAFVASGATLVDDNAAFSLGGNLIEMQLTENEAGIHVLIRCELTLRQGTRNAWQSVVFSQTQSDNADIAAAVIQGLNRLISELFMDDYFLMEMGIF